MTTEPLHIGLVFTYSFTFYRGILRGIRRYMEARPDWRFTVIVPDEHSLRMPVRHRPDGLITSMDTQHVVQSLSSWRRPAVDVSAVFAKVRFPRVRVDNGRVGQLAATHFRERGLQHFAFVGPKGHLYSDERRDAFSQSVQEFGFSVSHYEVRLEPPFDLLSQGWSLDPAFMQWLRGLPKPIGVFVPFDFWGVQMAESCRRAELRVPEDVALLGVDNDDAFCELARPPLSSIMLPTEQIGYEAAVQLERLICGARPTSESILLQPIGVATRRSTETLAIDDREVVAAIRYIREHAHLPIQVDEVLRQVPIGRRTLERRCRATLGWGLGEEIQRSHFERACRLLANTDLPMEAVAVQSGYSGFRHLGLAFRRTLSMAPSAYRGKMRSPVGESSP